MITPVFAGPTFEKKRLEGVFSYFECHASIINDVIMLPGLSTFNLTFSLLEYSQNFCNFT